MFAKARLLFKKLTDVPPVLISIGSESNTVCTVSGKNLSNESAADKITFSSARNTSLFLNKFIFFILLPTKVGLGAVVVSPAIRPVKLN